MTAVGAGTANSNSFSSPVSGETPALSVSSAMPIKDTIDAPQNGSESTNKDAVSTSHPLHIPPFMETTVSVEVEQDAHAHDNTLRFVLSKCQLPPRKEFEPVETFVANAVREQHELNSDNLPIKSYKGIIDAIRFKNDPVMLQRLLLALRTAGNGSTLHLLASSSSKHARLIHNIVRLNPFDIPVPTPTTAVGADASDQGSNNKSQSVEYDLADAQFHLMMALVSANSVFLVPIMFSLWKILTSQVQDAPVERTQRLHAAFATIIRLCPKAKMELFPIMSSNSPFRMRPGPELVWYYRQCLEVVQYLPSVRGHVLELLVDKSLEMDVEIKINDGGEATIDEEKEEKDEDIFQLDLDDTVDEKKPLVEGADVTVNEMADKLDSLMRLLFEFTEASILADPSSTTELYRVFSRVFESLILITHKSKFVQFLLLHLCGLENKALPALTSSEEAPLTLYRDFAAKLINIIVDPYRATVTRQTGACYLASFVSRASFVCPETACECICALLRWADAYMQSLGTVQVRANDARDQCNLHSLFYTVCQSACYIMCFRGVEAVKYYQYAANNPGGQHAELDIVDIGPERWNRICGHSLEPLRFCLESVRTEFLQLSRIYHLIDPSVLDRLEKSDRRMASVQQKKKPVSRIMTAATLQKQRLSAGVGGLGRGTNPLDSFFPFDPYLLRRSHGFIEPFYNHWGGSIEETFMEDDDDGLADDASAQSGDSGSSGTENGSDSDSNDDDNDDQSFRNPAGGPGMNPMSLASNATSASSRSSVLQPGGSLDVHLKRDQLQVEWTKTKRARAPSIENGSW